jgi:hypothetical protein
MYLTPLTTFTVSLCEFYFSGDSSGNRFFSVSGVDHGQTNLDFFHYIRGVYYTQLKSKVDNILTKDTSSRINLNIDGDPIVSRSHTLTSHTLKPLVSPVSYHESSSLSLGIPFPHST